MNVKVKKIHTDAVMPHYSHKDDAGVDLYSVEDYVIGPKQIVLVSTGIKIEIPEGYEGQVRPKSGLALQGIAIVNSPGTIDAGYRGEVKVVVMNLGEKEFVVKKKTKIAQLVFAKVERAELEEVEQLTNTTRGEGGFGSTSLGKRGV